jgi:crotonobetainyl-CoA:carnitine CoA-transferase CaiB-like acyl-CoA transferase
MMMAFAILAAVRKAEQTGQGQFVDIAMYDAMISLCERIIYQHDIEGSVPAPAGNGHPLLAPFGLFPARDGWVSIGVVDDGFWRALTQAMERPDLAADARLATKSGRRQNAAFVNETVSAWTRTLSKVELAGRLGGKLPFGPVNDVRDILTDPHVAVRQMIVTAPHPDPAEPGFRIAGNPVKFAAYPTPDVRPAPRLGEDTDDILGSLPDD